MCCCLLSKDEKKEKNSMMKPEFVNESNGGSGEMESDSRDRKTKMNKYADDDVMVPEIYDPDDAYGSASGDILRNDVITLSVQW